MGPMNPRMNPPRGPGMGPMGAGTYGPGMRGPPPNSSLGPGGGMPPMGMAGGRPQWQPNTSSVSALAYPSRSCVCEGTMDVLKCSVFSFSSR